MRFEEGEFISGDAAARLEALTPPGHRVFIHVTLTDEYPLAQAQVIIEAVAMAGVIVESPRSKTLEA